MRVSDQRRDDRLLCAGLVEVHWVDAEGKAFDTIANLDDFSPAGVSLLLDCPLPPGTQVEFSSSGISASGEVRYSNPTELGWIVGVAFGPDSKWDPVVRPPEHLLDPKSIPENARMGKGAPFAQKVSSPISCLALGDAVKREPE
jgi:hypothetical protein